MKAPVDENGIIKSWPMKWRKKCDKCWAYYISSKQHTCDKLMLGLVTNFNKKSSIKQ